MIGTILLTLLAVILLAMWNATRSRVTDEKEPDPEVDNLVFKIDEKVKLISEYYKRIFIGEERLKDSKWMTKNGGTSKEVPTWRLYQIYNNPETEEGREFLKRIRYLQWNYNKVKNNRPGVLPTQLSELKVIDMEVEGLFPEVFLPIKRDRMLNELGI